MQNATRTIDSWIILYTAYYILISQVTLFVRSPSQDILILNTGIYTCWIIYVIGWMATRHHEVDAEPSWAKKAMTCSVLAMIVIAIFYPLAAIADLAMLLFPMMKLEEDRRFPSLSDYREVVKLREALELDRKRER